MKEKLVQRVVPVVTLVLTLLLAAASPVLAANNSSGDIDLAEGTILAASFLVFWIVVGLLFWLMPQSKEKKMMPAIVAIGVAIAALAVVFYTTAWLTDISGITWWTEYLTYTGNETGLFISVAGSFLIWLIGGYAVYNERNSKKERNHLVVTLIAFAVWNILTLIPATTGLI